MKHFVLSVLLLFMGETFGSFDLGHLGLDDIKGNTTVELFNHFRCRVCEDLIVDNLELADGELVVNEKLVIKFCETFVTKVLHNAFGGVLCHTVVQTKLDELLKAIITSEIEAKLGEQICKGFHFCEK